MLYQKKAKFLPKNRTTSIDLLTDLSDNFGSTHNWYKKLSSNNQIYFWEFLVTIHIVLRLLPSRDRFFFINLDEVHSFE